ncbi:MAG: hypothetical protein UZ14_CFX002000399 [Chloroflexi bacterium OLB14]|nr:MAG: hypothetical protein UZ14_CFX002000399 [Chloroflexi bacterium OLB14]
MSSSNILKVIIAIAIGAGIGLIYGWVIDPIEYVDVTPNILRQDYQIDYVLMTAEAYHYDFDAQIAAKRLAILGSESPAEIVAKALQYANNNNFSELEIQSLQTLLTAMQTYQPQENP